MLQYFITDLNTRLISLKLHRRYRYINWSKKLLRIVKHFHLKTFKQTTILYYNLQLIITVIDLVITVA